MAQLVPSVLFYGQAAKLIKELREGYNTGIGSVDELASKLREALTSYQNGVGAPYLQYEPFAETEPPLSSKMNTILENLARDVNLLQNEEDILQAAAIFSHNLVVTEVMRSKQANARVSNKLKALQLYSDAVDSSIITFGDVFRSEEFIDTTLVPASQRALLVAEGNVTLAQEGELLSIADQADITVLPSSNGFLGNLHEVTGKTRKVATYKPTYIQFPDGSESLTFPDQGGYELTYLDEAIFKAETDPRSEIAAIADGMPNTWLEYESCLVSPSDRALAKGYGFAYYSEPQINGEVYDGDSDMGLLDWAAGPPGGVLKFGLQFDFGYTQTINFIEYVPFNLEDNVNYPVKVAQVQTSDDGTDWEVVNPQNLFVGTTPNVQAARAAEDVHIGDAVWSFSNRSVRYIRIYLEQANPINREIGHVYYMDGAGNRREGPIPSVSAPTYYYQPSQMTLSSNIIQRREVFQAKRWAIGVRDINVQRLKYTDESMIVSKPLRVGGIVDQVALEADVVIPEEYPDDEQWVQFFLTPDDGVTWFPISRIQDDYLGIPEIISFNDPLPEQFRSPNVGYYRSGVPVTSLRLKVVLRRPTDLTSTSPILKSYKLKVKKR